MADVEITIRLPEELVERAREVGIQIDKVTPDLIEMIERRIERQAALKRLLRIAEELDQLPPEEKPTPEEIDAEIRAYRAEQAAKRNSATTK